jgi:hypothetical protein
MKILSFDPSGNKGREGEGTSGYCIMETGKGTRLGEIRAKDFNSEVEYWAAHEDLIMSEFPSQIVCEGYKLYNHRGKSASIQANSELQTSQLIGVIKLVAYRMEIPIEIQFASEIKNRWSESVLTKMHYLDQKGDRYYFKGELTNLHKRDALKHALHFKQYKVGNK